MGITQRSNIELCREGGQFLIEINIENESWAQTPILRDLELLLMNRQETVAVAFWSHKMIPSEIVG